AAFEVAFAGKEGLKGTRTDVLFESHDGHVWTGTANALHEFIPDEGDGFRIQPYLTAEVFRDHGVQAITEDPDHNLWLGTRDGGAVRVIRGDFVTYGESDGLASRNIFSIFEDQKVRINISNGRAHSLSRFEKGIFVSVEPKYTAPVVNMGFRFGQT